VDNADQQACVPAMEAPVNMGLKVLAAAQQTQPRLTQTQAPI